MKSIILLFAFIISPVFIIAQVGIGTTNPNASLDIKSSSQATPTNKDGLLIPKIDEYPAINPTALQDGMLVFVTGDGSVAKGFYYWDNTASSWVEVNNGSSAEKINDLLDGKSDNDGTENGSSIFFGIDAGLNDDGSNNRNIGLGFNTLYNNVTGNRNIAIGFQTLYNNLLGEHNVANGYKALVLNTNGNDNTAAGYETLYRNTTGKSNVGFGFQVLRRNTDGDYNIGIGNKAGYFAKGDRNIFIGNEAGEGTANYNIDRSIFLGNQAGRYETNSDRLYIDNSQTTDPLIYGEFDTNLLRINGELQIGDPSTTGYKFPTTDGTANQVWHTDGNGNLIWTDIAAVAAQKINDLYDGKSDNDGTENGSSLFIGIDAGSADDSSDNKNVGVGFESLKNNTFGYDNTATGYQSLVSNTEGYANTTNGYQALFSNTTGSVNTAIGSQALYSNVEGLWNTAIGARSLYNTVGNGTTYYGYDNTANGVEALYSNTTGSYNTTSGSQSLYSNTTGDYNIAIGYKAAYLGTFTNSITLGYNATAATNEVHLGNASITAIQGQVNFSTYSDTRIKDNVKEGVIGLQFIKKLRPVTYNFNIDRQNKLMGVEDKSDYPEKYDLEKIKMSGFIAQEVEKAAQESNYNFSGVKTPKKATDLYGLSYAEFVVPLVKAIQEQQEIIKSLKAEVKALKELAIKKIK